MAEITFAEYKRLVEAAAKIEAVERLICNSPYVTVKEIGAVLDIKLEKEG